VHFDRLRICDKLRGIYPEGIKTGFCCGLGDTALPAESFSNPIMSFLQGHQWLKKFLLLDFSLCQRRRFLEKYPTILEPGSNEFNIGYLPLNHDFLCPF
jgi:hypothetical protein